VVSHRVAYSPTGANTPPLSTAGCRGVALINSLTFFLFTFSFGKLFDKLLPNILIVRKSYFLIR
jgi:hypothetical protein